MRTIEDIRKEIDEFEHKIYLLGEEIKALCDHPDYCRFERPAYNKPDETTVIYKCSECHKCEYFDKRQPEFESKLRPYYKNR